MRIGGQEYLIQLEVFQGRYSVLAHLKLITNLESRFPSFASDAITSPDSEAADTLRITWFGIRAIQNAVGASSYRASCELKVRGCQGKLDGTSSNIRQINVYPYQAISY